MVSLTNRAGSWAKGHLAELTISMCVMSLVSMTYTHIRTEGVYNKIQTHVANEEPILKSVVGINEALKKSPLERYGINALGGVTDKDMSEIKKKLDTLQSKITMLEVRIDLLGKMKK